jgi:DNA-binding CsgD family transcriptional regulator
LAELERCLSEGMTELKGAVIILDGPPGNGKTALLTEAAHRAARAGAFALSATCTSAERKLPFGAMNQLFISAQLTSEVTDSVDRVLSSDDTRAYHELCRILLLLSRSAPVMLFVDNVENADEHSKRTLLHLMGRLGTARVLLVLAGYRAAAQSRSTFDEELLGQPYRCEISLGPLSVAKVAHVLAERLGAHAPTQALAALSAEDFHAASGGNPGLLNSLIDDHLTSGQARQDGYGYTVQRCLHRHEPDVVRVAQALAVLDGPVLPAHVARLGAVGSETVSRTIRLLNDAGLLDGVRFRHPVARAAVLATVPAQARLELHRQAAELLYDAGCPASTVAVQLAEASRCDVPWAVPVLREAASDALLSQQASRAACYLELARHAQATTAERAKIRLAQLHAEWRGSPQAAVPHLTSLARDAAAGLLADGDAAALLRPLLWHGRTQESLSVLTRLHRPVGASEAPEASDVEAWLTLCYPLLAQRRRPSAVPIAPNPLASPGADRWLSVAACFSSVLTHGQSSQAASSAIRILQEIRLRHETCWEEEAGALALLVLLQADQPQAVLDSCDALFAHADGQLGATWRAVESCMRAEAALRLGDLTAALQAARQALSLVAPKAWGTTLGLPLGTLILAATRAGDFEEADRRLTHAVPDEMYASRYALPYLFARGHYYLAIEHYYAALADFLRCGELSREWGLDMAELVPWRSGAAQAWLLLANHDRARQLIQEQLGRAAAAPRNRGLALRALAAVSPQDRRAHLLGEAHDLFEDCGDRYEQALTLRDLSTVYSALGQNRRARILLRRARYLAEVCGAGPLCEELLAMQDGDGLTQAQAAHGKPPGLRKLLASLTDSECRVALLAARGYTNREIAAKLFVTPSTVEQHLTRVYRKLKIRHRRELSAVSGVPHPARGS